MHESHAMAQTRGVERDGARFAYLRWGNAASGQPPLFFLRCFRGEMDH